LPSFLPPFAVARLFEETLLEESARAGRLRVVATAEELSGFPPFWLETVEAETFV
jgi:hypothetical protein